MSAINPMYKYAQDIFNGLAGYWYTYCLENDNFYMYDEGYWKVVYEVEMLDTISNTLPDINKFPITAKKQVIENLKQLTMKRLERFNKGRFLNFKEGLYDPLTDKLFDHHPDDMSTIRLPYSFNYHSICPIWKKTLGEIFEGDKTKSDILQEFFGYCLTKDTNREKALLLLGESRTGKSTILQTLRNLVGDINCSSVPLKFISNPQYTPLLINKMVNIDSDVSGKAENFEAEFKVITSGEPVSCNQKFIATFEFIPYCKLVMAANIFPRITDHSSAFYKRLILIPCDRVFEESEQNIKLKGILNQELSGIFNWAVEGLHRLNERGHFERRDFMKDAVQQLREDSNPVEVFFREHLKSDVSADYEIIKPDLYDKYRKWCIDNGNMAMSSIRFGQEVYRKYSKFTPKQARSSTHGRPYVWKNLIYIGNESRGEQVNWSD